jgi:hypothetical protein
MQTSFFKLGLVIVALIAVSGCVHFSDVTYPLHTVPPQDMGIVADDNERGLTVTLAVTNTVPLPSESFLIDGRGRRYSLHVEPLEAFKDGPLYPRYHITASGPIPSDSRFLFSQGLYIISLAYTNAVSAKHNVVSRAFVIERQSMSSPIYYMMKNGH